MGNSEENVITFKLFRPGSESFDERQRRELEASQKKEYEQQRQELDRFLNDLSDRLHRHGYKALDAESRRTEIVKMHEEHRRDHPGFIKDFHQYVVDTVFGIVAPLSITIIDALVFAPTSERLVSISFPDMPGLASIARFIVPVPFVIMETAICLNLFHAIEESKIHTGKWRFTTGVIFWSIVALSAGLVLPLLALSALLISAPAKDPTGGFTLQQFGLTFLALAFHLGIIGAAATRLNAAFCFVSFWLKDQRSRRLIEKLRKVFTTARDNTLEAVRQLMRENDRYNDQYAPEPPRQFAVEDRVRKFINREQNEITLKVEAPESDPEPNAPTPVDGPNTPDNHADEGGADYERIIREQHRRSEEEVKP